MPEHKKLTFFVDVDNTLLNNDQVKQEIKKSLTQVLGQKEASHFWQHHDSLRKKTKLVDFPAITRAYCKENHTDTCTCGLTVSGIFNSIDFKKALYPKALEVMKHLKTLGQVFVFSEGDRIYQKMKIDKSGVAKAANKVLLYKHKLKHLTEVINQAAGSAPVFIDDKDITLKKIKKQHPAAITVVVCQGHYAKPKCATNHNADLVKSSIDELLNLSVNDFIISIKAPALRLF